MHADLLSVSVMVAGCIDTFKKEVNYGYAGNL